MSLPEILVHKLRVGSWPLLFRKIAVKGLIKRKGLTSLPFETQYDGFQYRGDAANMIDYHVLSRGGFERGLSELLKVWGNAGDAELFLDVGANVGVHSLPATRIYKKVIAIEPLPFLVDRLNGTFRANQIENIEVVRTALAAENGTVSFRLPDHGNLGTGSIVETPADTDQTGVIEVPVSVGDEIVEKSGLKLSAVKIDTEGAERKVLSGLQKSLEKDRPLVIFELLEEGSKHSDELRELFPERYDFFLLEGIKTKNFFLEKWSNGFGDVVAIPQEKVDCLKLYIR